MAKLQGSKTEVNLKAAFAGESQARNKYTYFAAKAKEEGFGAAAATFEENANNEREHARIWFKLLGGINGTPENLQEAAKGENYEHTNMYTAFAKTAKEEGFDDIADLFTQVGAIEKEHEKQFLKAIDKLKKAPPSTNETPTWRCVNCGFVIKSKNAPSQCSVCGQTDIAWSGSKAFKSVK
jgi:rubrerythrin